MFNYILSPGAPKALKHMVPKVKKRLQDAYRPATRRNHDTAFMAFLMYAIFYELSIKNIEIFSLLAFIEFLVDSKLTVATIKNYISALKAKLNALGIKTAAFHSPRVALVLLSLEKHQKVMFKPKPIITPVQFQSLFIKAEVLPLKLFFRMAIILAYMAFMRISNISPKSGGAYDVLRDIRRGDVRITASGIVIHIRWSKTLQKYRQTASIPLYAIPNSILCPKNNFINLQNQFPVKATDPLLSYNAGGVLRVVTQSQLRAAFSRLVQLLNLNSNLSFHSLRRSGASLAFASGVQFSSIQAHGTWTSDALWSYIDHSARDASVPALFAAIFSTNLGLG
jgi:integrase